MHIIYVIFFKLKFNVIICIILYALRLRISLISCMNNCQLEKSEERSPTKFTLYFLE